MDDLKSFVRALLDAWDAWIDTDTSDGPEYDTLAAAVEALKRHLTDQGS